MILERCAVFCTQRLIGTNHREELEQQAMQYGLTTLFYNLFTTAWVLLAAFLCGVLKETLLSVLVFASLRLLAGGFHCETQKRCILMSILCTTGGAVLSRYISFGIAAYLVFSGLLLGLTLRYAPSGTREHPIQEEERKPRKRKAVLLELFFLGLGYFILSIRSLLIFGIFFAVLTILPVCNRKYLLNTTEN